MQLGRIVIASALAITFAWTLTPTPAEARFPGRLLGPFAAPFRMLFRGFPHRHHRRVHRNTRADHHRPPADRQDTATGAAAAGATTGAAIPAERGEHNGQAEAATAGFWPSTSPSTYEDMVGYAFWPHDYERQFWSRGPRDIMQAMTAPTAAFASAGGTRTRGHRHLPITRSAKAGEAGHAACIARAKEHALAPLDRIPEAIDLHEQQKQKLAALRTAVGEAIERETASCRGDIPATQPQRLQALIDALWSMRYAEFYIDTSLQAFYDSLDDSQKARLGEEPQTVGSSAPAAASGPAAVCSSQPAGGANPFQPIERSLHLSGEQQKNVQMLYGASMDMAKFLRSSCAAETPQTPMARLHAAGDWVMSLLNAAMTIEPMLNQFYGSLSNEQRTRFNTAAR